MVLLFFLWQSKNKTRVGAREGKQASGPDSESQIELGVKPGLMTKSVSERYVKNLRRSNNRITVRA